MRRAICLSSLARSFIAESSNSISQAKFALDFLQGMRLAATRSQFRKAPFGFENIFEIFSLRAVILSSLNQRPSQLVGQNMLVVLASMRVDPVPTISAESMPAFRTNLLEPTSLRRLSESRSVLDQPERRILHQRRRRFSQDSSDLCQTRFLLGCEVNFHIGKCFNGAERCQPASQLPSPQAIMSLHVPIRS